LIALIDGDVIVYRTGWASEKEEEIIACVRAHKTMEDILAATAATSYYVYFSDTRENNFRYAISTDYKLSRQTQPKPKHYQALKDFLTKEWNAKVTPGQEADDALGINQSAIEMEWTCVDGADRSVICSIDKDLLQVPGLHYNFVRKEHQEVSYTQGLINFYSQFLIGDRVDDIVGVYGLGPKKTEKLLGGLQTEQELFEKVQAIYQDDQRLLKNGQLLWVRREPDQIWQFPEFFKSEVEDIQVDEASIQDEGGISSDTVIGHSDGE
jgi:5'-3' exonuclease